MLKTLTAALVAASMLVVPALSVTAEAAQPAAKPAATTTAKPVKHAKTHKHHVAKYNKRTKHVRHARHVNKHVVRGHSVKRAKIAKSQRNLIHTAKPAARTGVN